MGSFQIKQAIALFKEHDFRGDPEKLISGVIGIQESLAGNSENSMSWVNDKTSVALPVDKIKLGLIILSAKGFRNLTKASANFLIVENPRAAFFQIVEEFFKSPRTPKIESSSFIDPSVNLGVNCYVGHNVVIEKNCKVGNNTTILHNTSILEGTVIGNNVKIGCNNTIGNYGFGYEKDSEGNYFSLQHIGNVIIHDFVEIHNNTCVDRGVLDSTEIHENTKIDNLVHIAHGVVIGRNSLVIANAMIAGSVLVGENSWIAPSVSIKNKATIAPNTMTGIGAVILKDTHDGITYIGNPATTLEDYKSWSVLRKKLIDGDQK